MIYLNMLIVTIVEIHMPIFEICMLIRYLTSSDLLLFLKTFRSSL